MQTVDWGKVKQHLKKFPIRVLHNGINIETFTDKMVVIHCILILIYCTYNLCYHMQFGGVKFCNNDLHLS